MIFQIALFIHIPNVVPLSGTLPRVLHSIPYPLCVWEGAPLPSPLTALSFTPLTLSLPNTTSSHHTSLGYQVSTRLGVSFPTEARKDSPLLHIRSILYILLFEFPYSPMKKLLICFKISKIKFRVANVVCSWSNILGVF